MASPDVAGNLDVTKVERVTAPRLPAGAPLVMGDFDQETGLFKVDVFAPGDRAYAEALAAYRVALKTGVVDADSAVATSGEAAKAHIMTSVSLARHAFFRLTVGDWKVLLGEKAELGAPETELPSLVGQMLSGVPVVCNGGGRPRARILASAKVVAVADGVARIHGEGVDFDITEEDARAHLAAVVHPLDASAASADLLKLLKQLPCSGDPSLGPNQVCAAELREVAAAAGAVEYLFKRIAACDLSSAEFAFAASMFLEGLSARLEGKVVGTSFSCVPAALGRELKARAAAGEFVQLEGAKQVAPTRLSPKSPECAKKRPLSNALRSRAVSEAEWQSFLTESLEVTCTSERMMASEGKTYERKMGALERFLGNQCHASADTLRAGDAGMDGEALRDLLLTMHDAVVNGSPSKATSAVGGGPGGGASETEKMAALMGMRGTKLVGKARETQDAIRRAATNLAIDPSALKRLETMQRLSIDQAFTSLNLLKEQETNADVLLLLSVDSEVISETCAGTLGASYISMIERVRDALDARITHTLFPDKQERNALSAAQKKAMRKARCGELSNLRWLQLIGHASDSGTIDDPLGGFASRKEPMADLIAAINQLKAILTLVSPSQTGEAIVFFAMLERVFKEFRERGASWRILSGFFASVLLEMEEPARLFQVGSGGGKLLLKLSSDILKREGAVCAALERALGDEREAKKGKGVPLPTPPSDKIQAPTGGGDSQTYSREVWQGLCDRVDSEIGKHNGVNPCRLFFINGVCKRGASCKLHHEPASKAGTIVPKKK